MPRDGTYTYTQPFPDVSPDTTIASSVYNGFVHDVAADLNAPRPIVAGGTGASSAATALFNMGAETAAQVVTNYDSHVWAPGSFYSATTATGEPVDGHAFSGVAYIGEALTDPPANQNVTVEARDTTDGKLYIRRKTAGTWGSWTLDGDLSGVNAAIALKVAKAGDTMSGFLVLHADPDAAMKAATKQYVDTQAALQVLASGDTMSGFLVLHADPDAAMKAATKQYVDTADGAALTAANAAYQAKNAQLFAGVPINSASFPYTLVLTDAQKAIVGTGTATIPANSSVAFPTGTCITFAASGGAQTIAITTDTMTWYNGSSAVTGTRTLASGGIATAIKLTSTTWLISGNGLT